MGIVKILEIIQRKVLKGTHLPIQIKEIQAGYLCSPYFKDLYLYLSQNKLPPSKPVIRKIETFAEKYVMLDSLLFKISSDKDFHLNNFDDLDAATLKDTLDTLGLKIHNNFPTHRHGNTLDIIATEIASSLNITTCQPGPFLSDHSSIECTTNIIREDIIRKTVSFRKIKDINTQKFQDDVVNQLVMDN